MNSKSRNWEDYDQLKDYDNIKFDKFENKI